MKEWMSGGIRLCGLVFRKEVEVLRFLAL